MTVDLVDVDRFAAGPRRACDRLGWGSALRLAVRRNPAWTAGFSGFPSFDEFLALAVGPRSMR